MTNEPSADRHWLQVAGAAALGAAGMYILDPDKGRRRRAIARDKVGSAAIHTVRLARAAARDLAQRIVGIEAEAQRQLRHGAIRDELQLIERVRAVLGRVVSHPHAVQVGANRGRIVLSGPILSAEVLSLLTAVKAVPGVTEVDNELVEHLEPGTIPSLQSDPQAHRAAGTNRTPALRAAAVITGAILAAYAVRRRTSITLALAGLGLAMALRGATNRPIAPLVVPAASGLQASTGEENESRAP